jgi:aldose 1-epimerase
MACSSLRHAGEELLVRLAGPGMPDAPWIGGIPLLHPWANRIGGFAYRFDGEIVTLPPRSPDIVLDEHGLPMHGLLCATAGWETVTHEDARLVAARELTGCKPFPFDHRIEVAAELDGDTLSLTTTVTATGKRRVPIAFGYHPFLRLPGVPRQQWEIALPVAERLVLDDRMIPTGERHPAGSLDGPLGERTFDDGYTVDAGRGPFVLAGGGRRIEVAFERGYPYAQVFAPAFADVVCFEPMTAPTDALRHSPAAVAPGESFSARFSIRVV